MSRLDRMVGTIRLATAALAVAVALLLLMRIPLIETFRASLILLAALEVLSFGRQALSTDAWLRPAATLLVKLAVLATAYVALAS